MFSKRVMAERFTHFTANYCLKHSKNIKRKPRRTTSAVWSMFADLNSPLSPKLPDKDVLIFFSVEKNLQIMICTRHSASRLQHSHSRHSSAICEQNKKQMVNSSACIIELYIVADLVGAPNDCFLLNTLKTLFRLSRVLLQL